MATKQERPAKWRPDNRDPAKHRGRYLRAYRSARAVLEAGVPVDQARRFFELARSLELWDKGPCDAYAKETLCSVWARAEQDALAGREPCPIWGDF
jgi:hypothetical protein